MAINELNVLANRRNALRSTGAADGRGQEGGGPERAQARPDRSADDVVAG